MALTYRWVYFGILFAHCFFGILPEQMSLDEAVISTTDSYQVPPTVRISTTVHVPWMMKTADGKYDGFIANLIEEIATRTPFNYTIEEAPKQTHGMIDHLTGQWAGVLGEVISGKADIGAADLRITTERSSVVTFTTPFLATGAQILLKKPPNHPNPILTLLYPLSWVVWVLGVVVVAVVVVLLYIIDRFSPYGWRNSSKEFNEMKDKNSINAGKRYLFILGRLSWQGCQQIPRSISVCVLAAFWWTFVLLILISYSSNLTAYFLSTGGNKPYLPFKTFQEMALQSDVAYGGWFDLTLNPSDPLQRNMARFMESSYTHYHTIDEAVTRIQNSDGQFAAIVEGKDAEYIVRSNCDLILLREKLFPLKYGFACRQDDLGTRLCDIMSFAILSLLNDGTIHMLEDKWWHNDRICPETTENDYLSAANKPFIPFRGLTLSEVSFSFFVLLVGIGLSLTVLLLEMVYYKRNEDKQHPEDFDLQDAQNVECST